RGVGGALARSALHPRARPDRRPTRLREDAGAAPLALRRAHRLELPGAGAQAIEAFPSLSAYGKSSMLSAMRRGRASPWSPAGQAAPAERAGGACHELGLV